MVNYTRYEMGLPLERAAMLIIVHSIFYSLSASLTRRLAKTFRLKRLSGFDLLLLLAVMIGVFFFAKHCGAYGGAVSPIIRLQMIIFYDWRVGYSALFAIHAAIAVFVVFRIIKGFWASEENVQSKTAVNALQKIFLSAKRYLAIR